MEGIFARFRAIAYSRKGHFESSQTSLASSEGAISETDTPDYLALSLLHDVQRRIKAL